MFKLRFKSRLLMPYSLYGARLQGFTVVVFTVAKSRAWFDEYIYHDSLQARAIEGIGHWIVVWFHATGTLEFGQTLYNFDCNWSTVKCHTQCFLILLVTRFSQPSHNIKREVRDFSGLKRLKNTAG